MRGLLRSPLFSIVAILSLALGIGANIAIFTLIDQILLRKHAELVSGNFFSMLGIHAAIGRVFNSQEDDQVYQGHPVVVLSYDYSSTRRCSRTG